jgi:PGF-pre-PGF domain-containing protein
MQIRRIGRYQLLEIVGKGGQGTVYRGHDPSTGQIVAVKILAEEHSDGDFLERFQREASILASLEHPHVIKVFDHGEEEGRHFIVTEYVPENLARIIEQGDPLPIRRGLTVAAQIASALAVTHENGVTHRDVKPANVLISDSGDVKLTDFGIATADVMTTVTTPDATVGTPLYMSPEQIQSRDIDGRSDIYSLGCLLYQILTGRSPFQGESAYDIFNAHMNGEYEPLSKVIEDCPEELDNLLSKALEKSLNDRFQSADEFMNAIHNVADQLPDTGDQTLATRVMPRTIRSLSRRNSIWKRKNTWVTGVAAVAVLAIIGFAATTMLRGGSAVGLATGMTDAAESSLVPQASIIIPEEPELAADLPIAENVVFSSGPNPDYLYAQISIPAVADVGHLSNISASTRDFDGNEAKLNVESVKTDGLRAPLNVIFLRAMEITVDAGEVVTDTLPGIIEFQVKRQWIEEAGIQKNDISLYRFKDEWQSLPTIHEGSFIGSEDLFYERFSAKTPGFSRFAIGLILQTQDVQSIEPDLSKEAASPQQPPAVPLIQPSRTQSANEFPTPTPLAIVGLQTTKVPTPEPLTPQSVPTPIPAVVTPQIPVEAPSTQKPLPTATPIPPTQVPTPTRVPPTSTPTPSPTPIITEKVKDGSLIQLSTIQPANIEYPGDVDEWIYVPSSSMIGKSVNISVITDNPDSDGYLEFLSPSGDVVEEDDDSGFNLNPFISNALLSESGVYTIRLMFLDGTSGGYTLQIEPMDLTLQTSTATPTPVVTSTMTPASSQTPIASTLIGYWEFNNSGTSSWGQRQFSLANTSYHEDSLYLNGNYESHENGYTAEVEISDWNPEQYTGSIDFLIHPESDLQYMPILVSADCPGKIIVSLKEGRLNLLLGNQPFGEEYELEFSDYDLELAKNTWYNLTVSADFIDEKRIKAYIGEFLAIDESIPDEALLNPPCDYPSWSESATKYISFNNHNNATAFHGLIDNLKIHNGIVGPSGNPNFSTKLDAQSTPTVTPTMTPTPSDDVYNESSDANSPLAIDFCEESCSGQIGKAAIQGEINFVGDVDLYTVDIDPGMLVTVKVINEDNLDPMVELKESDGTFLHWDRYTTTTNDLDNATIAGLLIENGGNKQIWVKASDWLPDGSNQSTGTYSIYVDIVNPDELWWADPNDDDTGGGGTQIQFNQDTYGALDKLGDIDDWAFEGTAGDTVEVTLTKLVDTETAPMYPMIQLFNPDMEWYYSNSELQKSWDHEYIHYGNYTMSSVVESFEWSLEKTGPYVLRITTFNWESGYGPYRLRVNIDSPEPTATPSPTPTMTQTPIPASTLTTSTSMWNGTHGTTVFTDSASHNIGDGSRMWWSEGDGRKTSFFYSRNGVEVAQVKAQGHYACNGTPSYPNIVAMYSTYTSYDGFDGFSELSNVASFDYTGNTVIVFCTKDVAEHHSNIANNPELKNNGLMVYRKGTQYGVVEFVNMYNGDSNYPKYMTIKWWLGAPGITDFSNAPPQ